MDYSERLALSYYKTIATINSEHRIYLVQHQDTGKIYIKKILDIYNEAIYKELCANPVAGTPKVIEYFVENQELIVIEEYISGTTIEEKLSAGDISQENVFNYMLDLCDILHKLHSRTPALIHRDIKPSNVIITSCNHAMLLDFNAAKFYDDNSPSDTVLLGTKGYAAPEQYGFGSSSPQTDIYALGILLKEMTGSLKDLNISLADSLQRIINTCSNINPKMRYKNIDMLRKDLSRVFSSETEYAFKNRFYPPGFRSGTPWKMLVSGMYYLFAAFICSSSHANSLTGPGLWLIRLFLFAITFTIPAVCFNYLGLQRFMPLCSHKNRFLRKFGELLLIFTLIFALLMSMAFILKIFYS